MRFRYAYSPGNYYIYLVSGPPHSRIITFLIGNPNLNLHLTQASWVGGRPNISPKFRTGTRERGL